MEENLPAPAEMQRTAPMPWLLRRWLGFVLLGASLAIPGCTALFH